MKRYKLIRILFVIYLAVVAYLCFSNSSGLPRIMPVFGLPGFDKLVHFLMFLPFTPLLWFSFKQSGKGLSPEAVKRLSLICITGFAFGLSTELIQAIIPYREAEIKDLLADTLGIAASALVLVAIIKRKTRTK